MRTASGFVCVSFVIDAYSRRVLGWQASRSLRTDLALDALEMAIHTGQRTGADLHSVIHHSDRGCQYLSIRYSQRLADNVIVASAGSKGDSYDNAMIESLNGLFKRELIYPKDPGPESATSSTPSSNGSTGTTTGACTASSPAPPGTPPQQPTTTKPAQPKRLQHTTNSLYQTRRDSDGCVCWCCGVAARSSTATSWCAQVGVVCGLVLSVA